MIRYRKYTLEWVLYDRKFCKYNFKSPVRRIIRLYSKGEISMNRAGELIQEYINMLEGNAEVMMTKEIPPTPPRKRLKPQ